MSSTERVDTGDQPSPCGTTTPHALEQSSGAPHPQGLENEMGRGNDPQEKTTDATTADDGVCEGMSKNQRKRLAKEQRIRQKKLFKKEHMKQEREQRKAKKKESLQELWETMTPEEIEKDRQARKAKVMELRQKSKDKKVHLQKGLEDGQRIVIDYDFESYMHEGEIKSIVQQTNFTYGMNGKAKHPCHLILTSITGGIEKAFERQLPSRHSWIVTQTSKSYIKMFENEKQNLIYLTADAEDEIEELDKGKIYVIGGIVDKNRHKGLCYKRAQELGVATARLPIGEYIKLNRSPVMCTNHVVEILVKWQETKDWQQAFDAVVPGRKRMQPLSP